MLLTLTTTHRPATDLGFLLHKHPDRAHRFEFGFGAAQVFYPEASAERCTAALLLEIDPIGLVRSFRGVGEALERYVNDRPYAVSSFMSVVLAKVFNTALAGRCAQRPELVDTPLPLTVALPVLPSRGGAGLLERLFAPLGYRVNARPLALDSQFPRWGDSAYCSVELGITARLTDVLSHLYVLLPVLDAHKHYWIADDEVEKLLRHGEGWLGAHPDRELIAKRYLRFKRLTRLALERLNEDGSLEEEADAETPAPEEPLETPLSLDQARRAAVIARLREHQARRVVDLGCGEGKLVRALLDHGQFTEILGIDVASVSLARAAERLERLPERKRTRARLLQGALTYRDARIAGFDAATVVEVVEHLEPDRLPTFERVLFGHARPALVVVTTPNREYNALFENLPAGKLRHPDHRFEWTRAEFADWAARVAEAHGYRSSIEGIGAADPALGAPTQMAVFGHRPPKAE